jgi:hypothetical protein
MTCHKAGRMNVRLNLSLTMLAPGTGLLAAGLTGPGALGSSGKARNER